MKRRPNKLLTARAGMITGVFAVGAAAVALGVGSSSSDASPAVPPVANAHAAANAAADGNPARSASGGHHRYPTMSTPRDRPSARKPTRRPTSRSPT